MKSSSVAPILFIVAVVGGLTSFVIWGHPWAIYVLGGSGVIFAVSLFLHKEDDEGEKDRNEVPASVQTAEDMRREQAENQTPVTDHFMILQNHKSDQLDRLLPHIEKDARTISVAPDEGRYYSVPDGDDLAEWYTLHVTCSLKDKDDLIHDLGVEADSLFGFDHDLDFQSS